MEAVRPTRGAALAAGILLLSCGARSELAPQGGHAGDDAEVGGGEPLGGEPAQGGAPQATCGDGVVSPDESCDVAIDATLCDSSCKGRQTRSLAMSSVQVVAVRDEVPRIWGTNFFGVFNAPPVPNVVLSPTDLPFENIVEVDTYFGACLRDGTGTLRCAGPNTDGQLGIPPTGNEPLFNYTPVPVPPITQAALGGQHACALAADGVVYCWGARTSAQVDGVESSGWSPPTALALRDVVEIGATDTGSCARDRSGTITCWGEGEPGFRVIDLPPALELACGPSVACARIAGGEVACWGFKETAATVVEGAQGLVRLGRPAGAHACGVDLTARGICWGSNAFGALGRGSQSEAVESAGPVTVVTGVADIGAANGATCARLVDGRLACWGLDQNGVLGFEDGTFPSTAYPQAQFVAGFP